MSLCNNNGSPKCFWMALAEDVAVKAFCYPVHYHVQQTALEIVLVGNLQRFFGRSYQSCSTNSRRLIFFVPMHIKQLSTPRRVRPCFIEPMQVAPVRELPDGGLWSYEPKLDGYRCLAARLSSGVVLWSRRGTGFTNRFPAIARACEKLPADTLIDGEVIVVDDTGEVSFNALQQSRPKGHVQYYAFDLLVHRGRSVIRLPLEERRKLLRQVLQKAQYPVIQSVPFDVKPAELLRAAKELGLEGVIAKRKGSIYEPGRSSGAWVKYKINQLQEFVIGGYTAGNPFDALIVGCYEAGNRQAPIAGAVQEPAALICVRFCDGLLSLIDHRSFWSEQ
jgi:ATP-dependent DNA ligase